MTDLRSENEHLQAEVHRLTTELDALRPIAAEAGALRSELHAVLSDPVAHRSADGTITVDWPDGARSCLMARELLDETVATLNRLRQLITETLHGWAHTGDAGTDGRDPTDRILEIARTEHIDIDESCPLLTAGPCEGETP